MYANLHGQPTEERTSLNSLSSNVEVCHCRGNDFFLKKVVTLISSLVSCCCSQALKIVWAVYVGVDVLGMALGWGGLARAEVDVLSTKWL